MSNSGNTAHSRNARLNNDVPVESHGTKKHNYLNESLPNSGYLYLWPVY